MFHQSCTDFHSLSKREFWRFCNSFFTVVTTCEGVLWKNGKEIKGSSITLNRLRQIGKQIFFITNNSMRTRAEFVEKAKDLGFLIHKNEVISTSYLAAYYLKSRNFTDTAYVIGSRGLIKELDAAGIKYIGPGPDHSTEDIYETVENAFIDPNVKAVVVGLDEHFSYLKILKASTYLKNPHCEFIAVNCEEQKGGYNSMIVPGAGAILTAIESCSGRRALILGKSGTFLGKYLTTQYCVDSERTLFIGDRLQIDVSLGLSCGYQTLLTLSGGTHKEELNKKIKLNCMDQEGGNHLLPDLFTKTLEDLLPYLTLTKFKNA